MSASPDPVAEGAKYREMLLALLGDDDPVWVQSETPATLRRLIDQAGGALRTRPEPAEWSVLELVGHIADAELVMAARYRWTLAENEPQLIGYDQDLWVDGLAHNDDDPKDLLDLFEALRAANIALWRRTPVSGHERIGRHAERGPESYGDAFRMIAGHDRFHIAQIERTLEALTSS